MKKSRLIFNLIIMGVDFLALSSSLLLAYYIRTNIDVRPLASSTDLFEYLKLVFLAAGLGIIIFFITGLYNLKKPYGRLEELQKIFVAVSAGIMIIIALDFIRTKHIFPAKAIPIYGWILAIILVSISRQILREGQRYLFKFGIGVQSTIIIGANRISHLILSEIQKNPYLGYKVIGIFDKRKKEENFAGVKVLRNEEEISDLIKKQRVDEIIQANPQLPSKNVINLINLCDRYKIDFKFAPSLFGVYTTNTKVNIFAGVPVVELRKTPLEGWGRITKRLMDITGTSLALTIFSPILLIVALLVKITSKGPIFYKHKRLGRFGKEFELYKFRSMKLEYCMGDSYGGDKALENFQEILKDPQKKEEFSKDFKLRNDPRVTTLGKFLRKTSLDELPQLFNVLKGEISLVGPRPIVKEELKKFGNYKEQRLLLKPGITGLWQIGGRTDLSYQERAKLDIYYIENWSVFLDIKILFKTLLVFFKIKNAY